MKMMAIKEIIDMRAMDVLSALTTQELEELYAPIREVHEEMTVADSLEQMFDDYLRQRTTFFVVVVCAIRRCACGSPLRADKSIELGECEACRAKHQRH